MPAPSSSSTRRGNDDNDNHNADDPYRDFLVRREVWPKAHSVQLREHYDPSSTEDLAAERATRSSHRPLGGSVTSPHRAAGTSGAAYPHHHHPDDFEQEGLERVLHEKHAGGWTESLSEEQREQLLRCVKDAGRPEDVREDYKRLLDNPDIVLSARTVHQMTPDFQRIESHRRMHGWARYILPVSEDEVKNQQWRGKEDKGDGDKDEKKDEKADEKKDGDDHKETKEGDKGDDSSAQGDSQKAKQDGAKQDGHAKGGQGAAPSSSKTATTDEKQAASNDSQGKKRPAEHGDSTDNLTPSQKRFMDDIAAEARAIKNLKNASGVPRLDIADPDGQSQVGFEVQSADQFTPDNWIPRSDHLLRLTGKHPLNAEAPLQELYDAGMTTPVKLHYVRNHGSVPKLLWEHHTLQVFSDPPGLLPSPRSFSMDELAEMPCIEIPVTIACDGNRRGEVNMVQRSAGFTWSSSGVSTCRWKGVLVRDVLLACGLEPDDVGHRRLYLHTEGADEPSEGPYATSIELAHAMNPANDVLLAYGINGRVLSPDHGYPLRHIIPGYVGGRQVKWLKKLWISDKPNESHYHIWDNRVVPSFVTDKKSIEGQAFFHSPDTACNEQTLQSIITYPAHDECIPLTVEAAKRNPNIRDEEGQDPGDPLSKLYRVQGLAYNGGGAAISRVELSLDGGKTWRYCFRRFMDDALRHGEKYWTWVFWHCEVPIADLCKSTEICVRAFDRQKNTQPEHLTWNLLGMMNNCWYRVKGHTDLDPDSKEPCLRFRHPVAPGGKSGGWMKPSPEEQAKQEASAAASAGSDKEFTLEDVEKHNSEKDCWIILDNKVYDVTSVLDWHPGGKSAIMAYAGKATAQATADYDAIHDSYAREKTQEVLIGRLSEKGIKALKEDSVRVEKAQKELAESRKPYALKPFKYLPATLIKRKEISDDTRVYTFKLPELDGKPGRLGLPICKHVQIASHWRDSVVMRPYTPIRPVLPDEEDGTFDLLIKTYFPGASLFPPGGTQGNYLDTMVEGETIDINGPVGDISYLGRGVFEIEGTKHHFEKINLVAGGSGITPHWQLIHAILKKSDDPTQISLIDSNKTVADVLLREELEKYAEEHSDRFKLWLTVSKAPEEGDWKYSVGHLDEAMMRDHFFLPEGEKCATFLCGPPGLIKHGALPALQKLGFQEGKTCFGF